MAAIVQRLGVGGAERQYPIEAGEGVLRPAGRQQGHAQITPGVGVIRVQRQRAVVAGQRLVETPELI